MDILRFCLLLQLCVLAVSQKTALDSPANLYFYRQFRNWFLQNFGMRNEERSFSAQNLRNVQKKISESVPFPCNVTGGRSSKIPESVHRLRPGDIDVVAAMGDSLTAGNGLFATNLLEVAIENRGASVFIGGQGTWRTYLTLPNILKEFNPKLIGYAYGDSLTNQPASQLDVAEIGAMSRDMPFMAKYLVRRIKKDSRIDVKRHWKLISLFIGHNDICSDICTLSSPWSALDNHRLDLINTFKILRDNLPRTFVILHIMADLKELVAVREGKNFLKCYLTTTFSCPCLFALQFRDQRQKYYEIIKRWQNIEEEVADYPEFHTNDFTIAVSSVFKHGKIPLTEDGHYDLSYLSADCFHLSQKSNARLANDIWNALFEPIGNKSTDWASETNEKFVCPTAERQFLMTRENYKEINKVEG